MNKQIVSLGMPIYFLQTASLIFLCQWEPIYLSKDFLLCMYSYLSLPGNP